MPATRGNVHAPQPGLRCGEVFTGDQGDFGLNGLRRVLTIAPAPEAIPAGGDAGTGPWRARIWSRRRPRRRSPRGAIAPRTGIASRRSARGTTAATRGAPIPWDASSDPRSPALTDLGPATAVSDLVGSLVGEYIGNGPTARTYLNGDVITVVLEDTLTKGEERLVRDGMSELVLSTRRAFQRTMRDDLVAGVERITGRRVRVSANEMRPDISVEVFVLDDSSGRDPAGDAR